MKYILSFVTQDVQIIFFKMCSLTLDFHDIAIGINILTDGKNFDVLLTAVKLYTNDSCIQNTIKAAKKKYLYL